MNKGKRIFLHYKGGFKMKDQRNPLSDQKGESGQNKNSRGTG